MRQALALLILFVSVSTQAMRPSEPCEALLSMARWYFGPAVHSEERSEAAIRAFRQFRFDLGHPVVEPKLSKFHAQSSGVSTKDWLKVARQIEGIESFKTGDLATQEGRERWVFAIEGKDASKSFLNTLRRNQVGVRDAIAGDPNLTVSKVKRVGATFLALMVFVSNATYFPLWSEMLSGPVQTALAVGLVLANEPWSLFAYYLHRDPAFKKVQRSLESFGEKLEGLPLGDYRNAAQELPWHFDSWAYKVTTFLPEHLLKSSFESFETIVRMQDMFDSRGALFRMYRPWELRRAEEKGHISSDQGEMEKEVWVYFDLLQTVNVETGQPRLLLSIRSSKKRNPSFSTSPAAEKERAPEGFLVPAGT